ncbi:MAG: dienelactone hydrolase [Actinobacteria bacterium]|nr:dienelactone hydrolase [Actinomycetota bacterium]
MTGLLLFPGAGSASTHPSLIAIEQAAAPMRVVRADFAYRKAGRKAPDRPPVLLQAVRDEALAMLTVDDRLVLGGRSMGGRISSLAVGDAADPLPACGLVLICYPLHPPGKPDTLRVEHFPRLRVPCLFISGTKDAFGQPAELQRWTATIAGPVTHHWLEGKGHDLKGCDREIAAIVADWISSLT